MHRRPFFSLIAAAALVAFSGSNRAVAGTVLVFGQNGSADTITATNPTPSSTHISATDASISITQIAAPLTTPFNALLNLTADSVGAASIVGSNFVQTFSGSFSVTSGAGGTGTDYLSGTFSDAIFGSGASLTLSGSDTAPESLTFHSDVITTLGSPRGLSFSLTNVSPTVTGIPNGTIPAFISNVAGNASAASAASAVPEPSSMTLAAISALGMIGYGILRRKGA